MLDFSRKYRLADKKSFQSVFAKPYKITHQSLLALYQPNHLPHARLGIIVGKHLVKQAVDRNRLRRTIRESFRHHKNTLKGLDIIVILRSKCSAYMKQTKVGGISEQTVKKEKTLRNDIDNLWPLLANSSPRFLSR